MSLGTLGIFGDSKLEVDVEEQYMDVGDFFEAVTKSGLTVVVVVDVIAGVTLKKLLRKRFGGGGVCCSMYSLTAVLLAFMTSQSFRADFKKSCFLENLIWLISQFLFMYFS